MPSKLVGLDWESYRKILSEPVDLMGILDSLDISNETLGDAALRQGRLYMEASRFYVRAIKDATRTKARLEERKAYRARVYRKDGQKKTEGQIKEWVVLSPSVKKLQKKMNEAEAREEYGKLLLEALKMRRDAIRVLSEVLDDEARSDLRIYKEKRAQRQMAQVRKKLGRDEEE